MGSLSLSHWLLVLVVFALVFGPKRLASLGSSLGQGIRALRDGLEDPADPKQGSTESAPEKRRS